jgi:hypothetical protein
MDQLGPDRDGQDSSYNMRTMTDLNPQARQLADESMVRMTPGFYGSSGILCKSESHDRRPKH